MRLFFLFVLVLLFVQLLQSHAVLCVEILFFIKHSDNRLLLRNWYIDKNNNETDTFTGDDPSVVKPRIVFEMIDCTFGS